VGTSIEQLVGTRAMPGSKEVVLMHRVGADGKRHNTFEQCQRRAVDVELVCDNCGGLFYNTVGVYRSKINQGRNKFYCTNQCKHEHQSRNGNVELQCSNCGKTFYKERGEYRKIAKRDYNVYCSRDCAQEHFNEKSKVIFQCARCGTEKTVSRADYNDHLRRIHDSENRGPFCSYKCTRLDYYERYGAALSLPEEVELICSNPSCRKTFYRKRREYAKKFRRGYTEHYCSPACANEHHSYKNTKTCLNCGEYVTTYGRSKGAKFCSRACWHEWKPDPIKAVCLECGEEFLASSTRRAYCSRNCADEAHSKRMIGRNNPNYKRGYTNTKRSSTTGLFNALRVLALKRDNYTCAVCGREDKDLNKKDGDWLVVHHCDHNPFNNRLDNYITLCQSCHMVHHKSNETPYPWFEEEAMLRTEEADNELIEREQKITSRYETTAEEA